MCSIETKHLRISLKSLSIICIYIYICNSCFQLLLHSTCQNKPQRYLLLKPVLTDMSGNIHAFTNGIF